MPDKSRLVLVGRFGAAHGVRGEIRIKSFTADPLAIAGYGALCDADGARRFALTKARLVKDDMLVASVKGVTGREAAQALTNVDIFVPREALPPPGEDEFYLADLIGLDCVLEDGSAYGTVADVANYGAGDILEVRTAGGADVLLPFSRAVVPVVDIRAGRLVVVPPVDADGGEIGSAEGKHDDGGA